MLKAEKIAFSYHHKQLFNDLSLQISDHQITTIIGPNGSGKSTLFKLFTRELKPEHGMIELDKQNVWHIQPKKFAQEVAILHQKNAVYDEMSVLDLVKMGRLPYISWLGDAPENSEIENLLLYLEIDELKDKFLSELSGGQQQRVWLATALAQKPKYLFLDEPTTYLDLHFQYQFLKLIRKLNKEQNLTVCMILHDLNQAFQFSDQVVLLNQGKIVKKGTAEEVINQHTIEDNFGIKCELLKSKDGSTFIREY